MIIYGSAFKRIMYGYLTTKRDGHLEMRSLYQFFALCFTAESDISVDL